MTLWVTVYEIEHLVMVPSVDLGQPLQNSAKEGLIKLDT